MTTETPPPIDFQAQAQRFLDKLSLGEPANWPHQAVLAVARGSRMVWRATEDPSSAYSQLLREQFTLAVEDLLRHADDGLVDLQAVFLGGPAANGTASPFHAVIAGERLPPETTRLFGLIYDWLFTFLGKSPALNDTRFLDADLTEQVELCFYLRNPGLISAEEITGQVKAAFLARTNFTPPLLCRVKPSQALTPLTVLTNHCLHGWDFVEGRLRESWGALPLSEISVQFQHAVAVTRRALMTGGAAPGEVKTQLDRRIVRHYRRVKQDVNSSVCLDFLADEHTRTSVWRERNRVFFNHIRTGQYDRLLVEDATKSLDDRKGAAKENRFTISRVLGLEFEEQVIPAHEMVLKLRGFTHYRGDINNWLDLLKEYMSYTVIHRQTGSQSDYVLEIGPLLLTCERLDVPFSPEETRHWIGFFMEALTQFTKGQVFTCRVRYLSDFWAPEQAVSRVLRAAGRDDVPVDVRSLRAQLRKLALWLWEHNLSINYCDLVLYLDPDGRVDALRLIDLERLSFSELVGETHLLLDTMVDIKTHLQKEPWVHVLLNMFRSNDDPQGIPSLSAIQKYLNPKSRWRRCRLGFWRSLRRFFLRLNFLRGAQNLARLIAARARLSDVFRRSK